MKMQLMGAEEKLARRMAVLEKCNKRQDDVVNDMKAAIRSFLDERACFSMI